MRFHIVRRDNGTGGFNPNNIDALLDRLNRDFLPDGLSIQSVGFDFIDSTALFDADGDAEHNTLFATNNQANAMNFYIVNSASISGLNLAGRAQSILSRNFFVTAGRALTSTSSHELGHCLNLFHTHETAFGVERIDGRNCSTAGDRLCDTPADPELTTADVNAACNYIGGGGFNPDTRNIMAYGRRACRTRFTEDQLDKMKLTLDQSSVLANVISNNCQITEISGDDSVCSNGNTVLTLANAPAGIATNWATSGNILRVSSNNTSITIRGQNGTRAQGEVTVTFNGIVLRKDVWVGQPNPPSRISGPTTVQSGAIVNYSSTVSPGATGYEWWAPYPFTTVTNFNYFSRNWQVRRTTSRYMTAVTGTQGADGLIQVMGTNKCGRGGAKTLSVRHSTGGGGGGAIPLRVNLDFDDALTEDSVFPNPANSFLNIYLKDKESYGSIRYTLTAMDGKTVYDDIDNGKNGIDTSLLTEGQYILSIITEKGIQTKHIIINR